MTYCVAYNKDKDMFIINLCNDSLLAVFEIVAIDTYNKCNDQNQIVITSVLMPGRIEMEELDGDAPESISSLKPLLSIYTASSDKATDIYRKEIARKFPV